MDDNQTTATCETHGHVWGALGRCVMCGLQAPAPVQTTAEREYTREEMREACQNNYNAAQKNSANHRGTP